MVVSYNNLYTDVYANRDNLNPLRTNGDGGGNGGGGAFMKMFEETEEKEEKEEKNNTSSNPLDDIYSTNQNYYASSNVIKDYIDNSLLLNTEQVACTNIAQHIALKSNIKETLKFLNTQAAKTMVNAKKRPAVYQSMPQEKPEQPKTPENNFFKSGISTNPQKNFFIQ